MTNERKIVIIGAGPAGLGAAWRLQELGQTEVIGLEAAPSPGGLAASVLDDGGYLWDLGGHVQFSHYKYYDDVLDRAVDRWLHHQRRSEVWFRQRFVPYPFQLNIHRLDDGDRDAALAGLRRAAGAAGTRRPADFRQWMTATFGEELATLFLVPYNFKVWGTEAERMSWSWIGERVAVPDVERIERTIVTGQDDVRWGPNNSFRFPEQGGTGAIWTGVHDLLDPSPFRFGARVVRIDPDRRQVHTDDGQHHPYDAIVSTMAIDQLAGCIDGLDEDVVAAANSLRYTSTHIVGIGLQGAMPEALDGMCWMYFPEDNSPYYRVTVFSNYARSNAPADRDCWSLMAEICESDVKPVDGARVIDETERALREDGLLPPGCVVRTRWTRRLERGYPTPTRERDALLARVQPSLEALDILSRGRFGAWRYEISNQDHTFMQGVEAADRLIRGAAEPTIGDAALVNGGAFSDGGHPAQGHC